RLKQTLTGVVDRLLALQADDGYLGPWPKPERLRGHWDLWGHYHVMLALMMWHEQTGDPRAIQAARRIGDLVCSTFLDAPLRIIDAGSHEMNMAILQGLGRLYRETGEPRYLRMAGEIVKDFENAGDYYRLGLRGREFYRTPRPRWESLHCLQGLVEMYRITGDDTYRASFLHHWASIRRFDLRNTGGFSSGEQATGDPYTNQPIETCCVVAWQEVMMDALRLTGDSTIADDLESSTWNAMMGAQHPSGAWCTYNTPMEGQRIPSHIDIRFQARADTPQLNCCSVNGPRGYGSLCHWAVMQDEHRVVLNFLGPMQATLSRAGGSTLVIRQDTTYPRDGLIRVTVRPVTPRRFTLAVRIPAWSATSRVSIGDGPGQRAEPGCYHEIDRTWHPGDVVTLQLDMRLRFQAGDLAQYGKASLYRGPLLLAADTRYVEDDAAPIDLDRLDPSQTVRPEDPAATDTQSQEPWIAVDVPTVQQRMLRLIDFASAGVTTIDGQPISQYRTWLSAQPLPPPRPVAWKPADGEVLGPGAIRFVWRRPAEGAVTVRRHTVVVSESRQFDSVALQYGDQTGNWLVVPAGVTAALKPHTPYYWKIVA
ncbi:MAG: glycoside hydrolase family 127 protein, partial [Planctomycetes bacterium]|nr:glycoside hydrolase family 127 protein [Planctomycetota bacterium]